MRSAEAHAATPRLNAPAVASATARRARRPDVGMLEWFRPGEHDRVDRVLDDLKALGVTRAAHRHLLGRLLHPEGEAGTPGCSRSSPGA